MFVIPNNEVSLGKILEGTSKRVPANVRGGTSSSQRDLSSSRWRRRSLSADDVDYWIA